MSFKSAYNHGAEKPLFSSSGNVMRTTMKWVLDKDGKEILVEDKQYNIQDEINSYADECDIKSIVQRVSFDPEFAKAVAASSETDEVVDITDFPTNIHEAKREADSIPERMAELQKAISVEKTNESKEKTENEPKQ